MTIGPEPMTRIRWMSARRGMNQVVDDVLTGMTGRPAGGAPEFAAAADQYRDVDGTGQRRVARNLGRDTDALQDQLAERTHARPVSAGHVVGLTRDAKLHQRKIGIHHVGAVEEVAHRLAIPNREGAARRRKRQRALHERRQEELRRLPRPRMVEAPRADDANALTSLRLE